MYLSHVAFTRKSRWAFQRTIKSRWTQSFSTSRNGAEPHTGSIEELAPYAILYSIRSSKISQYVLYHQFVPRVVHTVQRGTCTRGTRSVVRVHVVQRSTCTRTDSTGMRV